MSETIDANQDGVEMFAEALYEYLLEIESSRQICILHGNNTAIHTTDSQALEVYRLYPRNEEVADCLRTGANLLPSWEQSHFWSSNASRLNKMKSGIEGRMKRNKRLLPLVTKGVAWQGIPLLLHGYKFEDDRLQGDVIKIEIDMIDLEAPTPELPIKLMASLLECHDFLVPNAVSAPLPPYTKHEANFITVQDFLKATMPENLYATQCSQRVSCHAVNGVGSRDTLREHQAAIASHSKYGPTQTT